MVQCHIRVTREQYAFLRQLSMDCSIGNAPNFFDEGKWQEGVKRILGITPKLVPNTKQYILVVKIKEG